MGWHEKTNGKGEVIQVWIDEAGQIDEAKRMILVEEDEDIVALRKIVFGMDLGTEPPGTFAMIYGSPPCEPFAFNSIDSGAFTDVDLPWRRAAESFRALGEAAKRASGAIRGWGDQVRRIDAITRDKVIDLKTVDDTNMRYADYWHQRDAYRPRAAAPRKPKRTRAYKGSSEAKKASQPRSRRRRSRRARKG